MTLETLQLQFCRITHFLRQTILLVHADLRRLSIWSLSLSFLCLTTTSSVQFSFTSEVSSMTSRNLYYASNNELAESPEIILRGIVEHGKVDVIERHQPVDDLQGHVGPKTPKTQ